MINIQSYGIKSYKFMDGTKTITCVNPTQRMLVEFMGIQDLDESAQSIEALGRMFSMILNDKDKHYAEETPIQIQIALLTDYFNFHMEQLGGRFPSSNSTEEQ